ncbi:MAG TPA: hypothetical protein VG096_06975 [Bryobacteraceae bacterium]|jgi:hypothetical protein|nr:hypothetical protein [Bryobacteraceae bacterium]
MLSFRANLFCLTCISGVLLIAADASWKAKPTAQWTEEDARQVLTKSPWARPVIAGIARRQSEDELREGGQMGQPKGIGYDGVDPKGSGPKLPSSPTDIFLPDKSGPSPRARVQSMPLMLRWESALPVRLAELKSQVLEPPTLEGEGYRIAVYGLPGGNFKGDPKKLGDPLKDEALLKREGKKDVKPSLVEVFPRSDGWVVVYLFPLSAEISPKDGRVQFEAHIGRIVVDQSFDLSEMEFQGKLEI